MRRWGEQMRLLWSKKPWWLVVVRCVLVIFATSY